MLFISFVFFTRQPFLVPFFSSPKFDIEFIEYVSMAPLMSKWTGSLSTLLGKEITGADVSSSSLILHSLVQFITALLAVCNFLSLDFDLQFLHEEVITKLYCSVLSHSITYITHHTRSERLKNEIRRKRNWRIHLPRLLKVPNEVNVSESRFSNASLTFILVIKCVVFIGTGELVG